MRKSIESTREQVNARGVDARVVDAREVDAREVDDASLAWSRRR
jgi:hypothetical protein